MGLIFHQRSAERPAIHGRPITSPELASGYDLEDVREAFEEFLGHRLFFARGVRVPEIAPVHGAGTSHVTFRASVGWQGADPAATSVVLRLPDPDAPEHDRMLREYRSQSLLRRAGLPVPEPAWTGFDDEVLGDHFYVMQLVRGRSTTDEPPYHQAGWLADMGPEAQADVWDEALAHMARLHRVDWPSAGFGFLAEELPDTETPLVDSLLARNRSVLGACGADPATERLLRALDWLEENVPEPDGPPTLVWLDPHLSNFLFDGTRCTAMLDWESLALGEPALDLAALVWTDEQEQRLAGRRLPGIPPEAETVVTYQALLGRSMASYPYYKILYAVLSASWLLLVHTRLVERGAIGPDDESAVPPELLDSIDEMVDDLDRVSGPPGRGGGQGPPLGLP